MTTGPGPTTALRPQALLTRIRVMALAGLVILGACSSAGRAPTTHPPAGTTAPSTISLAPDTTTANQITALERVTFFGDLDGYGLFWTSNETSLSCQMSVAPTNDGGTSFAAATQVGTVTADECADSGLSFDDAGDGFVFDPGLYITHDGGATWSETQTADTVVSVVPLGPSVWMLEDACTSGDHAPCLLLSQSADGGRTWSNTEPVAGSAGPNDDGAGSQVGGSQVGSNWMVRTSPTAADVFVAPEWFSTTDSGDSWQQHTAPCSDTAMNDAAMSDAMAMAPDGTLWLACSSEPGAGNQSKWVSRSTDGGATWTVQGPCQFGPPSPCAVPAGGYLGGVTAVSADEAFMVGNRSPAYETRNGGQTWTTVPTPGGLINGTSATLFVDPDYGWIIDDSWNDAGSLLRTVDGGATWATAWPTRSANGAAGDVVGASPTPAAA